MKGKYKRKTKGMYKTEWNKKWGKAKQKCNVNYHFGKLFALSTEAEHIPTLWPSKFTLRNILTKLCLHAYQKDELDNFDYLSKKLPNAHQKYNR